jgi:phospholipase/carboxylesterase
LDLTEVLVHPPQIPRLCAFGAPLGMTNGGDDYPSSMLPHVGNPIAYAGAPLESAAGAIIMVHGRNAGPANILDLFPALNRPQFAALAPAASGGTWYPYSFMAERERNEPGITGALQLLESTVGDLLARGFQSHTIVLLGFSQGACLSSEFSIRHPRRYGGVMALSGGLIGSPGTTWDDVSAPLDGTPVFLGCSDVDSHIPAERVLESEAVFRRLGANVTRKLYPGMGHTINNDEIEHVQRTLDNVLASAARQ